MGLFFKILRKERGLSLEQCSKGIFSKAGLSKFERGHSDITLKKFLLLMERLDISIPEFLNYINNRELSTVTLFFDKVKQAYKQGNTSLLLHYFQQEEEKYEQTAIISYRIKSTMILILLSSIDGCYKPSETRVIELSNYLFERERWYLFELLIFKNSVLLINPNLSSLLITELIKKKKNNNIPIYNKIISETLLNSTIVEFNKKNYDICLLYLNEVKHLLDPEDFFLKYVYQLLKECIKLKHKPDPNYDRLYFLLDILDTLGEDYQVVIYKNFVEKAIFTS
ncbi:helix-turn-helix domain-containing protein [Vagococcus xieshaowenii]|uniref:helix-turn-helix domain-containing protein n=1 Tax=Vagococcus xieshaowenii TaxID=2562451 RepID=UPI001F528C1C|nr:helix-turn-helix domain-containing protein [Vagococcus xieshaowenii]